MVLICKYTFGYLDINTFVNHEENELPKQERPSRD